MSTSVSRPPAETPLAELFTTWLPGAFARAIAAGAKPRDAVVSVDLAGALTGTRLPAADLAQVKGALRLEVPGFAGRTWAVTVVLGGADQPAATVSADLPTLAALRDGTLPPAQALFGGKIAMTGDVAWLMQVGMGFAGSGLGGPR